MAKSMNADDRAKRTVTVTFEDRSDRELLEQLARKQGMPASSLARELLLKTLHGDPLGESLVALEQRLEIIQRHVRVGPWLVLKAMEYRSDGLRVPDANEWIEEKMPPQGPAHRT